MPFLRPSDDVDEGRSLENFFALELRHAPDHADDKIPSSPGLMPLHFSQSGVDLLNGFFANAARVQYDDVRLGGIGDRLHALVQETAGDLFRVQLVHLASERLRSRSRGHFRHAIVAGRKGRDLRQVCDAQHLLGGRDVAQAASYGFRNASSDPGIDLVENERLSRFFGPADCLEGKHDARELASGSDSGEGFQFLTFVGRNHKLDAVDAGIREVAWYPPASIFRLVRVKADAEFGAFHGTRLEFLAYLPFELPGVPVALCGYSVPE